MVTGQTYNLLLVLRCFFYFLSRGRVAKKINGPKKILVAQLAKMGDMVCTTPMFRAIKNEYPSSKLYVMGDEVNKKLLSSSGDVDGYIVWHKDWRKMVQILSYEKFDFAALTGPSPETLSVLFLSGIPRIVAPILEGGYSPLRTKSYAILSKFVVTKPHRIGRYAPREYLRLLETFGIFTENTTKHLAFSQYSEKNVTDFYIKNGVTLGEDFIVGVFPSTGNKIKLWGRDKFAKVADYMIDRYKAKVIVFGSDSDRKEVDEFLSFLKDRSRVIDAAGAFNIDELKALFSKMAILVSVDTGPIYIAEAFGVGTVDIVGPVDENDQPPVGGIHKVVVAPRKKPEMGVFNARVYNKREALRQSEDITPEAVIKEIEDLAMDLDIAQWHDEDGFAPEIGPILVRAQSWLAKLPRDV